VSLSTIETSETSETSRNPPNRFFVSSRVKHHSRDTQEKTCDANSRPRAQTRLARQNDPTRVCVTSHKKKVKKILPACAKTRAPPGRHLASPRPSRVERAGHARTRLVTPVVDGVRLDAVPSSRPRTRPGEREGSSPPRARVGGTRHGARVTFPRAERSCSSVCSARRSRGAAAPPPRGPLGAGEAGRPPPWGRWSS
jgi:hypothetical protein